MIGERRSIGQAAPYEPPHHSVVRASYVLWCAGFRARGIRKKLDRMCGVRMTRPQIERMLNYIMESVDPRDVTGDELADANRHLRAISGGQWGIVRG